MNKIIITTLLILIAVFYVGKISSFADEGNNISKLNLNNPTRIDADQNIFQMSGDGKNKTQFRIKNNHNNENSEFMIKGVISVSSSDSITINEKTINIDSSVTGDTKIVGKTDVGAFALAKGITKDSNFYAEKIIVNQRNKNNIEEEEEKDDNEHLWLTPTVNPSVTPSQTQSSNTTKSDKTNLSSDLGNIIVRVQDFLNYLKDIASKI